MPLASISSTREPARIARVASVTAAVLALPSGCASPYSLLRPTPRAEMRSLSTDRPDLTESAMSVDPGHVQLEFDAASYQRRRLGGTTKNDLRIDTVNIRLGVGAHTDLQLVVTPFVGRVDVTQGSSPVRRAGFGDTCVRLKINLRGNDGTGFAIGLLPFVSIPTANGSVGLNAFAGGVAVPMSVALAAHVDLGMMLQVDLRPGSAQTLAYRFLETATLGFSTASPVGVFVEVAHATGVDGLAATTFEAHLGATYAISPDFRLDLGVFQTVYGYGHPTIAFFGGTYRY